MRVIRNFIITVLLVLFIGAFGFTLWTRDRYVVPILMYHHIGIPSAAKWRLNTVSEKSFRYQIHFLKRHGFRVISFDDLIKGIKEGQQFLRNTVVITFDDGYQDNYTNAYPVLKEYGFPATIFLISDFVDKPGFLTWDEVKEMEKHNIYFGSHTRHHAYLPRLDRAEALDEIAGSKKIIEDHLGHTINEFAYPSGGFSQETKDLMRETGFQAAVTTHRGKDRFNSDPYELKRIRINDTDDRYSGLILWCKLSGYYNFFREFKPGSRVSKRVIND